MSFLVPPRTFDPDHPEFMDRPDNDPELLEDDLANLRTINRFFGGLSAVRTHIGPFLDRCDRSRPAVILDLATGSADHPVALVEWTRSISRPVTILASDGNPQILDVARRRTRDYPEIRVERKRLPRLDYPDLHADIVLCSLALHHFSREDGVRLLREMKRVSRVGFLVNDLNRNRPAIWTAWLYAHATSRNPLTRHDSPLSVLRGFTSGELVSMAREAECPEIACECFWRTDAISRIPLSEAKAEGVDNDRPNNLSLQNP